MTLTAFGKRKTLFSSDFNHCLGTCGTTCSSSRKGKPWLGIDDNEPMPPAAYHDKMKFDERQ
jgi:hypothetical protein